MSNLYDAITTSIQASKGRNNKELAQVKVRDNQEWIYHEIKEAKP